MAALSCLVISRTPELLNRLLSSLVAARSRWSYGDEVLCSWNGAAEDEERIQPEGGPCLSREPIFRIAQRQPYHFARNMNELARLARGDLVLLVNDDVVLDPGSLDTALQTLEQHPEVAVVSGVLRTSDGRLGHAGVLFDDRHHPVNRCRPELAPLIQLDSPELQTSGAIPAVTGALMLLRRSDLLAVPLRESFQHCGEDITLCLDLRRQLGKTAYLASAVTAIHNEKSTRGNTADAADQTAVATIAADHLGRDPGLIALQDQWLAREAAWLTGLALKQYNTTLAADKALQQRLQLWQQERNTLIAAREDLRQRLLATWSSTSWRITAPLRLLGRLGNRLISRLQGRA